MKTLLVLYLTVCMISVVIAGVVGAIAAVAFAAAQAEVRAL